MSQQNEEEINYSKEELVQKLCKTSYSEEEKKSIFLSQNGRKCQTCHKLKINKKLSPFDFSAKHQKFICICHSQNNDDSSSKGFFQINQINDNNNDMNMNEDDSDHEENEINYSDQNNHNISSRQMSSNLSNQESDGGNGNNGNEVSNQSFPSRDISVSKVGDGSNGDEGSNQGNNGNGSNGSDGYNSISRENEFVTRAEFFQEINGINSRLDRMDRNIQQLLQNHNHN